MGRRGRVKVESRPHTSGWVTHKQEDNYNWGSPQGAMRPSFTSGSPAQASCIGKKGPQNIWLWRPVGLTFQRARGLWETETPLLQGTHKISHAPAARAEAVIWKTLDQIYLLIFESFLKRQEATGDHPWDTDANGSHLEELVLPWTLLLARAILELLHLVHHHWDPPPPTSLSAQVPACLRPTN